MVVHLANQRQKGPHCSLASDVSYRNSDWHNGVSIHTGIAFSQLPREPSPGTLLEEAPLVVVPAHHLDEGLVQRDARIGIEHAGAVSRHGSRWPPLCRWCSPARPVKCALSGPSFRRRFRRNWLVQPRSGPPRTRRCGHAEGHASELLVSAPGSPLPRPSRRRCCWG